MSKKYIDIEVFDGDDDIKYVRHKDMLNLLEQIRIKQEEKDKEIERLNNIINELDKQKEVLDKALFVLEHIEDDRAGYEAIKEILKGSDKE